MVGYTPGLLRYCVTHDPASSSCTARLSYYPWVGSVWYGPPVTYGFGSSMVYTPWSGWCTLRFRLSWGAPMSPAYWGWGPYPWWGRSGGVTTTIPILRPLLLRRRGLGSGRGGGLGAGGWAGRPATSTTVGRHRGGNAAVGRVQCLHRYRGATQVGAAYNSRTGMAAAGQRAAVGNVYTGNYAYGGRGALTNTNTGNTVTGGRLTVGNRGNGGERQRRLLRGESGGIAPGG